MATGDVEFRCFVGGLSWETDDQFLEEAFSQYGDILEAKIIYDRETGESKHYGFVTFKDELAMTDAIEGMNGKWLDGHTITVRKAESRDVKVAVGTVEVVVDTAVVDTGGEAELQKVTGEFEIGD